MSKEGANRIVSAPDRKPTATQAGVRGAGAIGADRAAANHPGEESLGDGSALWAGRRPFATTTTCAAGHVLRVRLGRGQTHGWSTSSARRGRARRAGRRT